MKNFSKLALLTFSLWFPPCFAVCPEDSEELYCRGGGGFNLKIINTAGNPNNAEIEGKFKKNQYSYNLVGSQAISPGSCAWFDRAITDAEPSKFHLSTSSLVQISQLQINLFSQCVPSLNCWMSLCAKNPGTGFLTIGGEISTTFGPP